MDRKVKAGFDFVLIQVPAHTQPRTVTVHPEMNEAKFMLLLRQFPVGRQH